MTRAAYRAAPRFIAEAVARAREGEQGCIDWPYSTSEGYGSIRIEGRARRAHLVALEVAGVLVVKGMDQRHTCGRRICININHQIKGTRAENMADAIAMGTIARGRRHGMVKLTEDDVRAIRASTEPQAVVAATYGIGGAQVSRIRTRKSWAWLD